MDQVNELVLLPFRDIIAKGNEAILNAGDENPDMRLAAQSLSKEGDRALRRLEPQCQRLYNEFGPIFLDALKDNAEITTHRTTLTDLLWEFDDYITPETFEPEPYKTLQVTSRKLAPKTSEILLCLRLTPPSIQTESIHSGSSGGDVASSIAPSDITSGTKIQQAFKDLNLQPRRPQIGMLLPGSPEPSPIHAFAPPTPIISPPPASPAPTGPLPPRPSSVNPWEIGYQPRMYQTRPRVGSGEYVGGFPSPPTRSHTFEGSTFGRESQEGGAWGTGELHPSDSASRRGSVAFRPRTKSIVSSVMSSQPGDESPILGMASPALQSPRMKIPPTMSIPEGLPFNQEYTAIQPGPRVSTGSGGTFGYDRRHSDFSTGSAGTAHTSIDGASTTGAASTKSTNSNPNPPVPGLISDDGLIPVTPAESDLPDHLVGRPLLKPALLGPDSSYNIMKGFCQGAYDVRRGEIGVTSIRKQTFSGSHTVGRCTHCMFELSYKELEYDLNRDDKGNFTLAGMGFRIRFLQKSHLATKRTDEQFYACMICVEMGHTVEESDATVFFTQKDLFHHISRHPRPLPPLPDLTIIQTPKVPEEQKNNYDLHIKGQQIVSLTRKRAAEIENMPTAICKETIKKLYGMRLLNDHTPAFEMAEGARIVGVEFLEKYKGEWCMGFHDGAYSSFPFDAVRLLAPPAAEVLRRNVATGISGTARWKFNPKYKKEHRGEWLRFDKGETISDISFLSRDHWCWAGSTGKGRWGFFPRAFIDERAVLDRGGVGETRDDDQVSLASSGRTSRVENTSGGFLKKFRKEKVPSLPGA